MIAMHFITVLLYFVFVQFWNLDCLKPKCIRYGKPACCPHLRYNKALNSCEDCPIGYHHWNCSKKCQHPDYGKNCQKKCNCSEDVCNFADGCPSIQFSTVVTTNSENGTTLHMTTRKTASTNTKQPNERTIAAEQPNDYLSQSTTFITIFGSVGLGLFLMLFGMFVVVYIYKSLQRNFGRMSVNEGVSKEDHSYTPIRLQPESQHRTAQVENEGENFGYLTPVSERICQYEEIDMYDMPDESADLNEYDVEPCYDDTANVDTDSYLTPKSAAKDTYLEMI